MPPVDFPASAPATLHWSGLSHCGKVRTNNEDAFLALTFDGHELRYLGKIGEATLGNADFVFAVSDGIGGAKSGEFASRIAIEKITRLLPRTFRLSAAGLNSGFNDVLQDLFAAIHSELLKLGQSYEECAGMGATLTLAWVTPDWLYFGHIGDSRLYYLPHKGGLQQLSHDHNQVGWMRRQGQINEREARNHPRRNVLQQVLGASTQFLDPQIGAVSYQPGDRFLICSDGLVDGLWDHQIEEIIRSPHPDQVHEPAAQRLITGALEGPGRDNLTALVIEVAAGFVTSASPGRPAPS
jgi:protein phosphatase